MDHNERRIVGITMLGHAMVHTFELSIPVFIPIWLDVFSLTPATMGAIVAVGYGLFGLGALPGGILADLYGSRRLILGCLLGMSLAFLAVSVAPTPLLLMAALVLWGIAASVYHPSGLSLISKGIEARGTGLAYHGMAGNVGIALGPLATLLLLVVFDWRTVAMLLTVPALVAVALVFLSGFEEPVPAEATDGGTRMDEFSFPEFLADSRALFTGAFVLVFGIIVLEGLFYRGALTFLPDLLAGLSRFDPVRIGGKTLDPGRYLYAGLLLVGIAGQYVGGRLTDRVRPERALIVTFAALAVVSILFIPAARAGAGPLLVASALLGVILFGEQPILQATVAEHSPAVVRGLSYGYMYIGIFGVGALGAAITGLILTYGTAAGLFAVLAAFCVVAAGLAALVVARY